MCQEVLIVIHKRCSPCVSASPRPLCWSFCSRVWQSERRRQLTDRKLEPASPPKQGALNPPRNALLPQLPPYSTRAHLKGPVTFNLHGFSLKSVNCGSGEFDLWYHGGKGDIYAFFPWEDKYNKTMTWWQQLFFSCLVSENSRSTVINKNNKKKVQLVPVYRYCGKWVLKPSTFLMTLLWMRIEIIK